MLITYRSIYDFGTFTYDIKAYLVYVGPLLGPKFPLNQTETLTAEEVGQLFGGN